MQVAKTVNAATKLMNIDKVQAVINYFSANCFATAPIAAQYKTLHLCNTWEDAYVRRQNEYTFLQGTAWQDIYEKYLQDFKRKDIKKVAVWGENRGANVNFVKGFNDTLVANGIETGLENYNVGERDFRLLIRKYKAMGFEYFWYMGIPPESDIILKQMHEAGIDNTHIYSVGADTGVLYNLYEGIEFGGYNLGTAEFVKRLRETYGVKQIYGASISYDLVRLVVDAYEQNYIEGKIPEAADVLNFVNSRGSYDCASEKCLVQKNGFIVNPATHRRVQNGQIVVVE